MRLIPHPTSLTTRLFLASAVLLPILLGFSGTMLHHAYQRSLQSAERDALRGQIYLLLGATEPTEQGIEIPANLPEARYSSINSGLIGWVVHPDNEVLWRSRSGDLVPPEDMPDVTAAFKPGHERFFEFEIADDTYYAIIYDTVWDTDSQERKFRFMVMQSRQPMYNELAAFRKRLWRWLGNLAVLLIIVQTTVARWGLAPLRKLAADLEKVETGAQEQLMGRYPADIQPVTDNLNRVLKSERAQRERYRNTLSDLAHSLKTPLAVIRGQLENLDDLPPPVLKRSVDEQVQRMSTIVDHQLRRASAQVTQATYNAIPVSPVIERLAGAMQKVYRSKGIDCKLQLQEGLSFHGDEADFMELAGNLIDNAFKYSRQQVRISTQDQAGDLHLLIEDDGAGVAPDMKNTILTRGARADTATPGHGIGLAVAVDILSSYGGSLDIGRSELGGAAFNLVMPNRKL